MMVENEIPTWNKIVALWMWMIIRVLLATHLWRRSLETQRNPSGK